MMKRSFDSFQESSTQQHRHLSHLLSLAACRATGQSISKIVAELRLHLREKNFHTYFFEMMMIFLKFESTINGLILFDANSQHTEMKDIITMMENQNQLIDAWEKYHSSFVAENGIKSDNKLFSTLTTLIVNEKLSSCVTKNSAQMDKNGLIFIDRERLLRLIQRHGKECIVNCLSGLIIDQHILFPYKKFAMKDPISCFHSLTVHKAQLSDAMYNIRGVVFRTGGMRGSADFFPLKYKGGYLSIISTNEDYHSTDIVTEYFQEDQRLRACRRDGQDKSQVLKSPLEVWNSPDNIKIISHFIDKNQDLSTFNLREAVYETTKECTQFKPTLAKAVIELFGATSMLDFSAGWGDRLVGALGTSSIQYYLGVDPNLGLKNGHDEIIRKLLPERESKWKSPNGIQSQFSIIYEPFQSCHLPEGKVFDLAFTSPPFFNFEVYTQLEGQSILDFPSYIDWVEKFLFVSLKKAWSVLAEGGHLVIHITDIGGFKICEIMNLYIQYCLSGSVYEGVIGSIGVSTDVTRPIWVWTKKSISQLTTEQRSRSARAKEHLSNFYNEFKSIV
jgi:hypothetical protein